ncbi:putative transition state regulator Abh (plasmid) [Paenibacillus polymyxa M1]|nr:putative transition state regulator Abh [Paenibacillus polymyxa M1]
MTLKTRILSNSETIIVQNKTLTVIKPIDFDFFIYVTVIFIYNILILIQRVSELKSTGMTRPLDVLGRIVIPKEMRTSMDFNVGDPVEIFMDQDTNTLAFRKYTGMSCKMCGSIEQLTYFKESFLCNDCIRELKSGNAISLPKKDTSNLFPQEKVRRSHYTTQQMIKKLKEIMLELPNSTQKEYAKILGTSQPRISQLKKLL